MKIAKKPTWQSISSLAKKILFTKISRILPCFPFSILTENISHQRLSWDSTMRESLMRNWGTCIRRKWPSTRLRSRVEISWFPNPGQGINTVEFVKMYTRTIMRYGILLCSTSIHKTTANRPEHPAFPNI